MRVQTIASLSLPTMQAPSCIERFTRLWIKHRRRWKCLLEVLIVDDGSTDNTAEVARELALAYLSVHLVLLHKNGGPAKARNAGLDVARGEWVAVLDADDAFMPERLERLTRAASDLNADVVLDNFAWYDATKNSVGSPGISPSSTVEVIDKYEFAMRARPYTDEADWGSLHYTGRALA
jgi:succinoglycan biosynthesis protein ExoO